MSHGTEKVMQKLKKNRFVVSKNDKNLVNFDPSTQFSKICTVICPFDQKKYRGIIFNDTEELCKI